MDLAGEVASKHGQQGGRIGRGPGPGLERLTEADVRVAPNPAIQLGRSGDVQLRAGSAAKAPVGSVCRGHPDRQATGPTFEDGARYRRSQRGPPDIHWGRLEISTRDG